METGSIEYNDRVAGKDCVMLGAVVPPDYGLAWVPFFNRMTNRGEGKRERGHLTKIRIFTNLRKGNRG